MRTERFTFQMALVVVVSIACLATATTARADTIAYPAGPADGNALNAFPFNSAMRYQQVYAASLFGTVAGPQYITQIAFRPDLGAGTPFNSTLTDVQIGLSTTSASPDGLSTVFANNVGADQTFVHSGPLTLSSNDVGFPARQFDIVINLTTPFLYDPAQGNLLLDVRNASIQTTGAFDAHNVFLDASSRIWGNLDSPTATLGGDTIALATQFTMRSAVVPTPSAAWGGAALMALASAWRLPRKPLAA